MELNKTFPESVKPGIPKLLADIPVGWRKVTMLDVFEVMERKAEIKDDEDYTLVTVKRRREGIVKRGVLKGGSIKVKSQFFVCENDFLISKRQIVHGACGVVPKELEGAIVSNEYLVLRPKEGFDLNFIKYYSNSIYFQQSCFHSSIGVHIEKMIFKPKWWFKFQHLLPEISEQQLISELLKTWDRSIKLTIQLIRAKESLKKGLKQKLLSGEIRVSNSLENWEEVKVGEIGKIGRGRVISKKEMRENKGIYPVYSSQTNNNGIMGFISSYDFEGEYITWTTDGANAGTVFHREGKFNCTNVCGTIKLSSDYDHRFVANMLSLHTHKHVSRNLANPKLMNGVMANIKIKIPKNKDEQKAISEIIDCIDRQISLLLEKLNFIKRQKKGLMQQILTGKIRVINY